MDKTPNPINRRSFLRFAAAGAATFTLPNFTGAAQRSGSKQLKKPNVLFIAIDDLNDWIGCLGGHPDVKTPNLDRLAARGVLFTNAHCSAPACNPSRASLMTGILPSTSGIYHNPNPWRQSPVLKDAVTIPQHFIANGYSAVGGGKIYHGGFPDPASWQDYFPSQQKNKPDDPMPPKRPLNGIPNTAHFDWGPVDVGDEKMGDSQVASWAISQLRKKHDKPFFLACGFFRPHLPWYVPQNYFDMSPADKVTLPNVKEDDLDDVPPMKSIFRMLTWQKGLFDLDPPDEREFPSEISLSVQEVLMEGLRQLDEFNEIRNELPDLNTRLVLSQPVIPPLRDLKPEELDILQLAHNSPARLTGQGRFERRQRRIGRPQATEVDDVPIGGSVRRIGRLSECLCGGRGGSG